MRRNVAGSFVLVFGVALSGCATIFHAKPQAPPGSMDMVTVLPSASASPSIDSSKEDKKKSSKKRPKKNKAIANLPKEYREWFETWDFLMSDVEKKEFVLLAEGYAGDAVKKTYMLDEFKKQFWARRSLDRDGFPTDAERVYSERMAWAKQFLRDASGRSEAARLLVILGDPDGRQAISCEDILVPIQIWYYDRLEQHKANKVSLIFYRSRGMGSWKLWLPLDGLNALVSNPTVSMNAGSEGMGNNGIDLKTIAQKCFEWRTLLGAMASTEAFLGSGAMGMAGAAKLFQPPQVNDEAVKRMLRYATDIRPGEQEFKLAQDTTVEFFKGRNSTSANTAVRTTFFVPTPPLTKRMLGSDRFYNLDVVVVVLKVMEDGSVDKVVELDKTGIFMPTRVGFSFPVQDMNGIVGLPVDIELYPRTYYLVAKVIDMNNDKTVAKWERVVTVPEASLLESASTAPRDTSSSSSVNVALPSAQASTPENTPLPQKAETIVPTIVLMLPEKDFLSGTQTIDTKTLPEVRSVKFYLDNALVMERTRPPFQASFDLGKTPQKHVIRAVAYGEDKAVSIGEDAAVINKGNNSFSAQIVAPKRDFHGTGFVTVTTSIFTSRDQRVKKVDFYVDQDLRGTVTAAPWTHAVEIPSSQITYVRIVATLEDGTIAEDAFYVNAPGYVENVNVDAVELYVTATDSNGDLAQDLTEKDFKVYENGKPQTVESFGYVKNVPITVGMLIDTSSSMKDSMNEVLEAAAAFIDTTITEKDRGFTISFSGEPQLLVAPTSDKAKLKSVLAGLTATGGTALYDAVMAGLYQLQDIKGKRVLALLSDGEDNREQATTVGGQPAEGSKFDYATLREYAKRSGVAIYPIVLLNNASISAQAKAKLQELASSTGGKIYYAKKASELNSVYAAINRELHSQYLLTYYSTLTDMKAWRKVEVKATKPNISTRTIRGYYP